MDDRELDLTEQQVATKSKYPPINKKYEYLDHTADVQIHSWGNNLEEAFEQCVMGMFGYMTDTETVEPLDTVDVESQGDDMESLLFHFLDDWLYKFCADLFFIPREVKVLHIDRVNFKIRSIGWGEEFSLDKHPQGTEPGSCAIKLQVGLMNDMASPQKKLKMDDTKYLPELLAEKDSLDSSFTHAMKLISAEIDRIQKGETKKDNDKEPYLDLFTTKNLKLKERVLIPLKQFPRVNFVGKILGPGGNTIKRLQEETGAKISVLGKGSMKDKNKEEELRKGGEAKYSHLSMELHVFVEVHAPIPEAYLRMAHAMDEVKKFLTPEPEGVEWAEAEVDHLEQGGGGCLVEVLVELCGVPQGEPQDAVAPEEHQGRVVLRAEGVQQVAPGLQQQELLGCSLHQHFHTKFPLPLNRAKQMVMMNIPVMINLMPREGPMKAMTITVNKELLRILNTTTTAMVTVRMQHTNLTLKMTGKAPGPLVGLGAKLQLPDRRRAPTENILMEDTEQLMTQDSESATGP
uniref:KH domain-containing, RNA-binding, signal transduction-associated protein 1 n=1 Tax=Knipowitschia caucasica TaxID=637954 RepID=A0AAV2JGW5_KNICA